MSRLPPNQIWWQQGAAGEYAKYMIFVTFIVFPQTDLGAISPTDFHAK